MGVTAVLFMLGECHLTRTLMTVEGRVTVRRMRASECEWQGAGEESKEGKGAYEGKRYPVE